MHTTKVAMHNVNNVRIFGVHQYNVCIVQMKYTYTHAIICDGHAQHAYLVIAIAQQRECCSAAGEELQLVVEHLTIRKNNHHCKLDDDDDDADTCTRRACMKGSEEDEACCRDEKKKKDWTKVDEPANSPE
jgi:hypothetical protein